MKGIFVRWGRVLWERLRYGKTVDSRRNVIDIYRVWHIFRIRTLDVSSVKPFLELVSFYYQTLAHISLVHCAFHKRRALPVAIWQLNRDYISLDAIEVVQETFL